MPTYSTFHVPGIDAGVSLALLRHLFKRMEAPGGAHFSLTHSKGGKANTLWVEHRNSMGHAGVGLDCTIAHMHQTYSKAGNFRVDYVFKSGLSRLDDIAEVLGLEPADNRRPPRDVRFFGGE